MALFTGASGVVTVAAAPTSGTAQVETATIVGTIATPGTATFTVTSAVVTGSPLAVDVDVLAGDTATIVAAKAAAKLKATAAIWDDFVVTSNGADLIFTAIVSAANDATLNVAFTNGTCTGLTPNATSANTTAGVLGEFRGMANGACLVDTTGKKVYMNTGTPGTPTWSLL